LDESALSASKSSFLAGRSPFPQVITSSPKYLTYIHLPGQLRGLSRPVESAEAPGLVLESSLELLECLRRLTFRQQHLAK
jgi:hypothetical protein